MQAHIGGTVPAQVHPKEKEAHYFDKEQHFFDKEERFKKGLGYYLHHYPECPNDGRRLFAMDATPEYMRIPGMAHRIHGAYEGHTRAVRVIIVLRSPTERVRSWYDHLGLLNGRARVTLDHWVEASLKRVRECGQLHKVDVTSNALWTSECRDLGGPYGDAIAGGLYAPQIAEWLRWFPPHQVMVISFSGYVKHADKVLKDVAEFIGSERRQPRVHARQQRRRLAPAANSTRISQDERVPADDGVAAAPGALRRRLIAASHANKKGRHSLNPRSRAALDAFYKPHVAHLMKLFKSPAAKGVQSSPIGPLHALSAKTLVSG